MYLSALERKILNLIQKGIPLRSRPFKSLSKIAGIEEDEFLKNIKRLMKRGIIRSICANLNHKKLGLESSLIALRVPVAKAASLAKKLINYPEVTHCYLRQGDYNLWIVFLCLEKKKLNGFLNRLAKQVGRQNILNLPTKRQFKLKTTLKI